MGLFIAQEEGELSDVSGYSMAVAGAEFNVAVGLARLNLPVTYLTRLGKTLWSENCAHAAAQWNWQRVCQLFQRTFHRLYAEKQSQHR